MERKTRGQAQGRVLNRNRAEHTTPWDTQFSR